jgi:enoyl-CoA hydratase/carnithine racemase
VLGLERLVWLAGADAARDMVITGRVVPASEALECGLLTDLRASVELEAAVEHIASGALELPAETLADVLTVTRASSGADRAHLTRSLARPGLAAALARYASGALTSARR